MKEAANGSGLVRRGDPAKRRLAKPFGTALASRRRRDDALRDEFADALGLAPVVQAGNGKIVCRAEHLQGFRVKRIVGPNELENLRHERAPLVAVQPGAQIGLSATNAWQSRCR